MIWPEGTEVGIYDRHGRQLLRVVDVDSFGVFSEPLTVGPDELAYVAIPAPALMSLPPGRYDRLP